MGMTPLPWPRCGTGVSVGGRCSEGGTEQRALALGEQLLQGGQFVFRGQADLVGSGARARARFS
jgi:hypothetical protein